MKRNWFRILSLVLAMCMLCGIALADKTVASESVELSTPTNLEDNTTVEEDTSAEEADVYAALIAALQGSAPVYVKTVSATAVYGNAAMTARLGRLTGSAQLVADACDTVNRSVHVYFLAEDEVIAGYVDMEKMSPAATAIAADKLASGAVPVVTAALTAPAWEPKEAPVEEPVEETPAEEPVEETPAEEPTEETPVEEPVEEPAVEETVEAPAPEIVNAYIYVEDAKEAYDYGERITIHSAVEVANATADTVVTYQWQCMAADGTEWENIPGAVDAVYVVEMSPETRGVQWRVVVDLENSEVAE